MGTQPHFPKGGEAPPQFSAHFYCGQTAGCNKMPLGMEVVLSPGDFLLDGDPTLFSKKRAEPGAGAEPPQFSAHVYCGQTAGWIKMALGMEVVVGPGHIVLDGYQAPLPQKGGRFHLYCGQTAGCIKIPLGMEVGLSQGDFVLDGDPVPYFKRGGPANFRPTSIMAKRLHGSRSWCKV